MSKVILEATAQAQYRAGASLYAHAMIHADMQQSIAPFQPILTRRTNKVARTMPLMELTLSELEQAINHWRALRPSYGEEHALSPEVDTLANVYALMIFNHQKSTPFDSLSSNERALIERWRAQKTAQAS